MGVKDSDVKIYLTNNIGTVRNITRHINTKEKQS